MITGDPDPERISTSYVEREPDDADGLAALHAAHQRLLQEGQNHAAMVALHYMYYNFARPHTSLRNPYPRTPAMAAGVADHIWSCDEIAASLDSEQS